MSSSHVEMKLYTDYYPLAETKKYVDYAVQKGKPASNFRLFDRLYLSNIGIGSYLGKLTHED